MYSKISNYSNPIRLFILILLLLARIIHKYFYYELKLPAIKGNV